MQGSAFARNNDNLVSKPKAKGSLHTTVPSLQKRQSSTNQLETHKKRKETGFTQLFTNGVQYVIYCLLPPLPALAPGYAAASKYIQHKLFHSDCFGDADKTRLVKSRQEACAICTHVAQESVAGEQQSLQETSR